MDMRHGIGKPVRARSRGQPTVHVLATVITLCITALTGCAPGADLPPLAQANDAVGAYRLGSGDQLRIITFAEEQLTGDFRVNDTGGVAMPLVGVIAATGLTPIELANRIEAQLRQQNLLSNPNVSVEVTTYRPVFILGEVTKPGEYPFHPGMTLLSTVSVAGGFTYRAIQDYASIVRSVDDKIIEGKVTRQTRIQPGDVISIFERNF